jgi:hypothetical protein
MDGHESRKKQGDNVQNGRKCSQDIFLHYVNLLNLQLFETHHKWSDQEPEEENVSIFEQDFSIASHDEKKM